MEIELGKVLYVGLGIFAGATITQFVAWLFKRWNKIEDNSEKAVSEDKARKIIQDELALRDKTISELKKDLKAMAESMLSAVEKQEARLDQLVMHLLNDRGDKK